MWRFRALHVHRSRGQILAQSDRFFVYAPDPNSNFFNNLNGVLFVANHTCRPALDAWQLSAERSHQHEEREQCQAP
jgi:hypothetical protein